MSYKWNVKKAQRCIRRFYIADEKLSGCHRQDTTNYVDACRIVDWLTDRFEVDVNSPDWRATFSGSKEWSWSPSKLINSVLDTASRQLPPYMTAPDKFYPFKKNI